MKLRATDEPNVALVLFLKDKTGGVRPARRLTSCPSGDKK